MSDIGISSVLSQIRQLRTQAEAMKPAAAVAPGMAAAAQAGTRPTGFAQALESAVRAVNGAQNESARMAQAFELGDPRADVASVMLAMQKSSVTFRAVVEVRNRMVQAYQDVMNMPM
jgi:flagellar hook-basal body complex protein FliE